MGGDQFYSMELMGATGVVVVAGTGFKQVEGTLHFRTTFLPSEKDIDSVVDRVTQFHVHGEVPGLKSLTALQSRYFGGGAAAPPSARDFFLRRGPKSARTCPTASCIFIQLYSRK